MKKYLCFCLLWVCTLTLWGQSNGGYGGDYNPTNPAIPNEPSSMLKYTLTLNAGKGGRVSTTPSGTEFTEGAMIGLSAFPNTGYKFVNWKQGETIVSTSQSFHFKMPAQNVEMIATFVYDPALPPIPDVIPFTHKVSAEVFPSNAGNVDYNNSEVKEGSRTYVNAIAKPGYKFEGWLYDGDTISTSAYYSFTMQAYDMHFVALFTYDPVSPNLPNNNPNSSRTYTISYVIDGVTYFTEKVPAGSTITRIDLPTKEGYVFNGWKDIPTVMPKANLTIEGSFTPNNYNITYMINGEIYRTVTLGFETIIPPMDAPSKEGYSFLGWEGIPTIMPSNDFTVHAVYSKNYYALAYIIDGELYYTDSIEYENPIIPIEKPIKEGYTFSGWDNIPATMPAKDITVNGSYSINRYNLTYVIDGEVYKSDSITYNDAITPIDSPIKEGHTFSGWRNVPATMPAQDVVINGSFSINSYNVTYVLDGEVYSKETYLYGAPIIPIDTPSKEGYSFSGWTNLPTNMPAQDVTASGKFNINSYKLTYMVDGEVYRTETYLYGSIINPINPPTKEGYISRWKNIPTTMPAEDSVCEIEYILNSTQIDEQGIIYTPSETGETFMVSSFTNTLVEEVVIPTELYSLPVTAILDNALSGATTMKSLVIPASIKSVGNQAFSGCNNLLVIEWNTELPLEATCFDEPEKYGNMLVFTNSEGTFAGNVITNGTAEEILLLDGQPFRNPKQFTAKQISYTRKFSKKTKVGTAGGWEGIVLPFDVQKIAHEGKGVLEPFGVTDFTTSLPCWIGEWLRSSSSFVLTRSNLANQPFIMEVPNSEDYEEKFNIEGDVTFSAENAIVYATTENNSVNTNRVTICGTYEGVTASPLVYALNDEEYTAPDGNKFMPGGVFVADSRDIRPFEAYAYNALLTHTRYMPIQGRMATSIDRILLKEKTDDDTWYTIQGIRLKSKPTQKGLYIHNGKTIVIK